MKRRFLAAVLTAIALAGCGDKTKKAPSGEPSSSALSAAASSSAEPAAIVGNAEHGHALMLLFECQRCHSMPALGDPPPEKQCIGCHQRILDGDFNAPKADIDVWVKRVAYVRDAPSIVYSNRVLEADWIARFLLSPYDLRPNMAATMPRFSLTPQQAANIAAYFGKPAGPDIPPLGDDAAAERGRALIETKGCLTCHTFSVKKPFASMPAANAGFEAPPAIVLAPDLRNARDRMKRSTLVDWITSPESMRPDTKMPKTPLTEREVKDIAHYILTAELAPRPVKPIPARLPVLTRAVTFDELSTKVLRRTCWHCHAEPDLVRGDGGPGNTGGFGFMPRGFIVTDYAGIRSGELDEEGNRRSVFLAMKDGTPRLLRALLARQREEAGEVDPEIRGMPLGFPALSPQDVQLVESWIAQGEPR